MPGSDEKNKRFLVFQHLEMSVLKVYAICKAGRRRVIQDTFLIAPGCCCLGQLKLRPSSFLGINHWNEIFEALAFTFNHCNPFELGMLL